MPIPDANTAAISNLGHESIRLTRPDVALRADGKRRDSRRRHLSELSACEHGGLTPVRAEIPVTHPHRFDTAGYVLLHYEVPRLILRSVRTRLFDPCPRPAVGA